MFTRRSAAALGLLLMLPSTTFAQQPIDSAYSRIIRELTPTDPRWKFTTELVETLPASPTVPTPLEVLGYVPGTLGRLSYVADINKYFRAVANAAPGRTRLVSMGLSDEGRETIALFVADEQSIARLDEHRTKLARLADPRGLPGAERNALIKEAKPIYWLSGSIHSPEAGSPEMLMELAYRMVVDESPMMQSIRANVITMITPVTEVDGRDRQVDVAKLSRSLKLGNSGVPLVYWGKYTAHDNNRDGMVMSQKLTQNFVRGFLQWKPVVVHDLHESVPFLYTSTGTGPYNDEYDPIVIDEWHTLAYQEITELTRRGLPGVWTHSFYDGWAPNYTLLAVANLHNSIGRFYETYTSSNAGCLTVNLQASALERTWDRPNPPVNGVRWCIRNNINYQQSGVLIALKYVGDHRETFLENYVAKAERMIQRGKTSAPYAFVIPRGQRHATEAADLVNLFRAQGAEVHVATADYALSTGPARQSSPTPVTGSPDVVALVRRDSLREGPADTTGTKAAPTTRSSVTMVRTGDWIVRLDQPYSATVRTLLAIQKYKADDPPPYDDTGWTLDELRHVETIKVADSSIFSRPMQLLTADAVVTGTVGGSFPTVLVKHLGDWRSAVLPWKIAPGKVSVAEAAFTSNGTGYPAGTFIIDDVSEKTRNTIAALGLNGTSASGVSVRRHSVTLPRIALMHSWLETQNEGWIRFAFDQMGIPYTYISDQSIRKPGALDKFDVVMFPHVSGSGTALLNGRPMVGPPIPWKKTETTPNLDKWDQTDDIRPGMGLDGAANLRRFVERGGLLITTGNSTRLPIDVGFTTSVSIPATTRLQARGGIYRAQVVESGSPIMYGYDTKTFPVYFNQSPLMSVAARDTVRAEGVDQSIMDQREGMRAKVILRYHEKADSLLVSGLLVAGEEMAGRAAVVDAPVGSGHVVMFGMRPLWRWESQGSFAMAVNAIANWKSLNSR